MYIVVEGCIGSGKTTAAKLLAAERNSDLILEQFEDNPFLKKFYLNPSLYALETELAFVLIHYHQAFHEFQQQKNVEYIADFHISKDLLFAEINLNKEDLALFRSLYSALTRRLPKPDIMVYLKCSDELILKRIKQRNQGNENSIDPEYFVKLNNRYDKYFAEVEISKIEVDINKLDFVNSSENIAWLSNKIDERLSL